MRQALDLQVAGANLNLNLPHQYFSGSRSRLQHNAHFRDKRCQKRRQRVPKTAPLAPRGPRDREPLFLGLCSQMPRILLPSPPTYPLFAGPKYRKPKMGPHDLRAWSFEDGYLCSILHGLLQLQIWTAFLLSARLFPTIVRQSAI
jgi:hypothetical protein